MREFGEQTVEARGAVGGYVVARAGEDVGACDGPFDLGVAGRVEEGCAVGGGG